MTFRVSEIEYLTGENTAGQTLKSALRCVLCSDSDTASARGKFSATKRQWDEVRQTMENLLYDMP